MGRREAPAHPDAASRRDGPPRRHVDAPRSRRIASAPPAGSRAARDVVVVLKGARTVIADPDGRVAINCSGNPGLGSGGTGDVLAGILGGLLAQGYPAPDAARLGVFLHGHAADRVAARRGMIGLLASDVIEELPAATAALAAHAGA